MTVTSVVGELISEMETRFKEKGLFNELNALVDKAVEMTDSQVEGALLVMRSPLIIPTGTIPNVMDLKNEDGSVDKRIEVARAQAELPWDPNAAFNGKVLMGMWRRVVEVEALNRGLADVSLQKVMSVLSKRVVELPILVETSEVASEASEVASDEPQKKAGYTTKNIPDALRKKVVELRDQGMVWHSIETALGLRQNRGMTATYIYKKAMQARK